jgi:hypothetical protein
MRGGEDAIPRWTCYPIRLAPGNKRISNNWSKFTTKVKLSVAGTVKTKMAKEKVKICGGTGKKDGTTTAGSDLVC